MPLVYTKLDTFQEHAGPNGMGNIETALGISSDLKLILDKVKIDCGVKDFAFSRVCCTSCLGCMFWAFNINAIKHTTKVKISFFIGYDILNVRNRFLPIL